MRYLLLYFMPLLFLRLGTSGLTGGEPECGLRVLYVGSVALGLQDEYAAFRARAPATPDSGFSIEQLKELGEENGFHAIAVRTTFERLAARASEERFSCIAWLHEGHYVLLANIDGDSVHFVDPPREQTTDRRVFSQRWGGEVLLISSGQLADESVYEEGTSVMSSWLPWLIGATAAVVSATFLRKRASR